MKNYTQISTSKQKFVGIAIVCWNNEKILSECLDSVLKQTYKYTKTIVLDNNSTDNSADLVSSHYPWARLIEYTTNSGFAKGNNIIIKEFLKDESIKYIALINSDASLDPSWVEELVKAVESTAHAAFLQGLTLDYYNHKVIDSTHIYVNRKGQSIQANYRRELKELDLNTTKVFGVNAAACMVTRNYLTSQPFDYLFDEDFYMYLEDVDVAIRSRVLGWTNYFIPEAVAYHMGSASSGKNPGFSVFMVSRNVLPMLFKNLPIPLIVKMIPKMILADVRELYRIIRGKNYKLVSKFIQGRLMGLVLLPRYLRKRLLLSKVRVIKNSKMWKLMNDGTEK